MFNKRLVLGFIIITLASYIYSWPMAYHYMLLQASPATSGNVSVTGEPAKAEIAVVHKPAQITAAAVQYYPEKYNEEYFYRVSSNEPIRDFRYYKVKKFNPTTKYYEAQNKQPIRDFRYYTNTTSNLDYRVETSSNSDYTVKHNRPIRDFRYDLWSSK